MQRLFVSVFVFISFCASAAFPQEGANGDQAVKERLKAASELFGLEMSDDELELMLEGSLWDGEDYQAIRERSLDNAVMPALQFNPIPRGFEISEKDDFFRASPPDTITRPDDINKLAFYSVRDLAHLIQTRQVTSSELTRLYLSRLKQYGPMLECVVTLTEERALQQAAIADHEIAAGHYRGLLHGIPYGAKDLLAVKGYPTTWGAKPYENQNIDYDAEVIQRLDEAGAVLVAKLTLGALAMGDIWYGGKTRNPWNPEQGSSGSSAGSASATAAGLVAFAIGSETNGSIISPSIRCGTTGLRPSYGRVSRDGAMALSWSMDKLGPICRTVEDCAIVLKAIQGLDPNDPTTIKAPFRYDAQSQVNELRIGYLKTKFDEDYDNREFDRATLDTFEAMGVTLEPVEFPDFNYSALFVILSAEAAAAFDELTRSGRDDELVNQRVWAWPNSFRKARFIPAVEYIQANRIRTQLIEEMHTIVNQYDAIIAPPYQGNSMLITNLTGHPCVVLPNGFKDDGTPTGITMIGRLFGEGRLLAAAKAYQDATEFHQRQPELKLYAEK